MYPTAKVSKEVNRKYRPRNTMVQLSTPYTDPEPHNAAAQCHGQTDRQTTGQYDANSRSHCVFIFFYA